MKRMLALESADIETNPEPRRSSFIKFCHLNLNGLAAHDFVKILLIEVFITTHNFGIIWGYMLVGNFLRFKHRHQ